MNENFPDEEKLYRAVFSSNRFPNFWKENGKVSSAAFKKKEGLSVERGNFRSDVAVVEDMKKSFEGIIISVTVKQCRDVNAIIKYLPTARSVYHSEIYSSNVRKQLTDAQAKQLANHSRIVKKR